ncbi:alpha/beta hydrolase [Anabaena cylindrica FACHB-243]|uniref:Alpha/beta hydrolase fold protein n=1 Tax=Anabaena cylindrica (strain ATCC 27899 / PCC 7122) TaxID=272123 RepID=K9ZQQ7_ANACC|nr:MULTISPECIES: alpha/beta hydrolase [Anabaena]AFZ60882.1 alpha/beta hydrolase fold protein [Anabaena cylindrica PCC 7122]MBD2420499.1 alpha/beta hydrolase [Anabaena cylindrica FACHB-243]MBY5284641.1 alpha/beta hydrolase [Anabaena sp. CCAP 1446/1C]MBY5309724.1 alpha/beta hydrolase [Anabaena sp. CCAP 1446/1C]MCM2406877.1 alpha/beta hydrolase [Anabaena sp. CCAP 1446/1C]
MPYINVRGVEHYYEWIKSSSDSEVKPVMVFIHGWAGSSRYWRSTAEALLDKFDCLLYDMRGFGRSHGKPTIVQTAESVVESQSKQEKKEAIQELTYELEDYAEDLAALLDGLHLQRVYINAHSMGASIATLFFNRYPQRVEKGILTCSGIFEYDEKAFTSFYKFGGLVVKFRPKWLGKIPLADKMFMARFLHSPIPKSERTAFLQDFIDADYDAALGTIFTSVSKKQADFMPQEFSKLTVPTLLVAGEYDIIIPAKMGEKAAQLSENVEFALIPNTAHFPMLEDPETYLRKIQEFLNN